MQNVQFVSKNQLVDAELLIVCDHQMEAKLDAELNGAVSFNLKREEKSVWMTTNGLYPIPKLVFVRNSSDILQVATCKQIAIAISDEAANLAFELMLNKPEVETVTFLCADPEKEKAHFMAHYAPLLHAICRSKELIAAPANLMTPQLFANQCQNLEKQGVHVDVFGVDQLKEMGAEALLSVGKGSAHPPYMVVMHYKGSNDSPIALVGKGVCFDAGGIHLKSAFLNEMKWDKAGAGVVFGTLDALSRMRTPINIVGVIGLAENMPDGAALKPGDVISTLAGKTIEIVDTDCEGRLVLADCMTYVQEAFSPKVVIDLGTLALETFGALGGKYAGLFCPDQTLAQSLIKAGEKAQEELWPLPLGEYFKGHLHSAIADMKNAGIERYGASSAAAEFLRSFIDSQVSWAHIDIAGVSWDLKNPSQGVTGFGVRLLVEWAKMFLNS